MTGFRRALFAEAIGSLLLFATVIGSGIMAEHLSGGNVAVALLGNTLATGAMLFVLITMLGPISGAHFNPAVTLVFRLRGEVGSLATLAYVAAQLAGGIVGVIFDTTAALDEYKDVAGPKKVVGVAASIAVHYIEVKIGALAGAARVGGALLPFGPEAAIAGAAVGGAAGAYAGEWSADETDATIHTWLAA